jgi:hypothetical protein
MMPVASCRQCLTNQSVPFSTTGIGYQPRIRSLSPDLWERRRDLAGPCAGLLARPLRNVALLCEVPASLKVDWNADAAPRDTFHHYTVDSC